MPTDTKYMTTAESEGAISPEELEAILKRHNSYGVRTIDHEDLKAFHKETGSYPVFTSEAADSIRNHVEEANDSKEKPFLLSLGSGSGFSEACLAGHGVPVVATDLYEIGEDGPGSFYGKRESFQGKTHIPVEKLSSVDAVKKYKGETNSFAFVYPSYSESGGSGDALEEIVKNADDSGEPTRIIHIGEATSGGSTGDEKFWEIIRDEGMEEIARVKLPFTKYQDIASMVYEYVPPERDSEED